MPTDWTPSPYHHIATHYWHLATLAIAHMDYKLGHTYQSRAATYWELSQPTNPHPYAAYRNPYTLAPEPIHAH